jgi:hypothetical protein
VTALKGQIPLFTVHRKAPVSNARAVRLWLQQATRKYKLVAQLATRITSHKYLLCRPQGGWNDILVQIAICFDYCLKSSRQLIVDTSRSGLLDDLCKYFRPIVGSRGISFSMPHGFEEKSKTMSCFPACLTGKGTEYTAVFRDGINYVELSSGQQLTFDACRDYQEDLLVYEQCGGGNKSKECFEWIRLTPEAKHEIRHRTCGLPANYSALHVRHSDVKCRYIEFFEAVKWELSGRNVLVCTDSAEALAAAQVMLTESKTYSISNIPDTNGASLHHSPGITDWNVNVGALCDLAAMSHASEILVPSPVLGYPSGFATLAVNLMQTKAFALC